MIIVSENICVSMKILQIKTLHLRKKSSVSNRYRFANPPAVLWWQTDFRCSLVIRPHVHSAALFSHFTVICLNSLAAHCTTFCATTLIGAPAALGCSAKWCQGKYKQSANMCSSLSPLYFSLSHQELSPCFLYQLRSHLDQHIFYASLLDHSMKHNVSCFAYAFISFCWFSILRIFQRLHYSYCSGQWQNTMLSSSSPNSLIFSHLSNRINVNWNTNVKAFQKPYQSRIILFHLSHLKYLAVIRLHSF